MLTRTERYAATIVLFGPLYAGCVVPAGPAGQRGGTEGGRFARLFAGQLSPEPSVHFFLQIFVFSMY